MAYVKVIKVFTGEIMFKYDVDPSGDGFRLIKMRTPDEWSKPYHEAAKGLVNDFLKEEWEMNSDEYERNKHYDV